MMLFNRSNGPFRSGSSLIQSNGLARRHLVHVSKARGSCDATTPIPMFSALGQPNGVRNAVEFELMHHFSRCFTGSVSRRLMDSGYGRKKRHPFNRLFANFSAAETAASRFAYESSESSFLGIDLPSGCLAFIAIVQRPAAVICRKSMKTRHPLMSVISVSWRYGSIFSPYLKAILP